MSRSNAVQRYEVIYKVASGAWWPSDWTDSLTAAKTIAKKLRSKPEVCDTDIRDRHTEYLVEIYKSGSHLVRPLASSAIAKALIDLELAEIRFIPPSGMRTHDLAYIALTEAGEKRAISAL